MYYSKSTEQWRVKKNGKLLVSYGEGINGEYAKILAGMSEESGEKYKNYYTFDENYGYLHLYNINYGYMTCAFDICMYEIVKNYRWYLREHFHTFYCETTYNGSHIKMHKLVTNTSSDEIVDHIDRNGLNNTLLNLRIASVSINGRNASVYNTNTTGFSGVSYSEDNNMILSNYVTLDGQKVTKCFPINWYGIDLALELAIVFRYENAILHGYMFSPDQISRYYMAKGYVENIVCSN